MLRKWYAQKTALMCHCLRTDWDRGGGETLVKKELGSNMGVLFENRGDKNPL